MASKVEALVRNFLKTDGEALCLVLGQRLALKRGATKSPVGREPLSEETFRAIADELAPGELLESLVETRFRLPFQLDDLTEPVEVEFGSSGALPAITIVRAQPPVTETAAPERRAPAPPAPGDRGGSGASSASRSPASSTSASRSASSTTAGTNAAASAAAESAPAARGSRVSGVDAGSASRPIDKILLRMLEQEASDLHLSSGYVPVFRVHGEISPQMDLGQMSSEDVEKLLDPILQPKSRQEFQERCDTDFAHEIPDVSRFRVNVFRDRRGVGAVFRQIPIEILSAATLNLPPAVVQLGDLTKGLVLVTGPTGSGKSTTLAAIIDHVNETRSDHIITIEDPIEFVHPNKKCLVNQREVGSHTRGFKEALRAALREDPDIVLVGEMRDLETVAIAIETAETGHLVFGTLHTTTAPSTVDRIVDQFPEDRQPQIRIMLADSLRGVVSQTLLRKKGGGRVAALEVLLSNNAVANLVRDAKTFQLPSVMQTSKAQGMILLNDSLLDLVRRGVVEPREAYLKSVDKPGLLAAFKSVNNPAISEFRPDSPTAAPQESPVGASR